MPYDTLPITVPVVGSLPLTNLWDHATTQSEKDLSDLWGDGRDTTPQGNTAQAVTGFDLNGVGEAVNSIAGVNSANAFNAEQAQANRDFTTAERIAAEQFNSAEAQKQRDFLYQMDATAVQRRMADLRQAGLNPMLAYSQAAGSGSGASAASVGHSSGSAATSSGSSATVVGALIAALGMIARAAL